MTTSFLRGVADARVRDFKEFVPISGCVIYFALQQGNCQLMLYRLQVLFMCMCVFSVGSWPSVLHVVSFLAMARRDMTEKAQILNYLKSAEKVSLPSRLHASSLLIRQKILPMSKNASLCEQYA